MENKTRCLIVLHFQHDVLWESICGISTNRWQCIGHNTGYFEAGDRSAVLGSSRMHLLYPGQEPL